MIAEKEKVSSLGLADLSPLGRKAVYRMSDLDPTVLQCINMSGLYRTIWNEISDYATDRRMETVLALERRTEFSADTFKREKQLAEIYLVGQRAADEALESCVKWLALECRECSTIAELAGISLDMMTGKRKQ